MLNGATRPYLAFCFVAEVAYICVQGKQQLGAEFLPMYSLPAGFKFLSVTLNTALEESKLLE